MRLPYRLYRETVAKPLGQANAPFEIDEVQRGVISWIDTIDVDGDGRADFRAWVRAYENGEPLYVGIYTVVRIDDVAYVAVGFPLPAGNFTATLQPRCAPVSVARSADTVIDRSPGLLGGPYATT